MIKIHIINEDEVLKELLIKIENQPKTITEHFIKDEIKNGFNIMKDDLEI